MIVWNHMLANSNYPLPEERLKKTLILKLSNNHLLILIRHHVLIKIY